MDAAWQTEELLQQVHDADLSISEQHNLSFPFAEALC